MFEPSLYQPLGNHLAVARNGTTQSQVQFSTEYPVTRIETIADGTINFGKVGYLAAPTDGYELQPGDILYSHINSIKHVGKVAQYFGEKKTLYHGMNLLLLRLDSEVDKRYFFHYLNSYNARHYAQKECQKAINQVSLNTGQLKKLSVFTPTLPEQRLIAHILDTLDTQIQKTEALIAKLEKVKEGLLQDLLTRGIDENGQLRPSPEKAPELYKESPLGLLPREWTIGTLGQRLSQYGGFIQTGPFGSQLHAEEYVIEGIPVVMPQDMRDIEVSKENVAQITEERASDLVRHRVIEGDLLFSRRGDLSRCSYISEANKGWVCGTGCLLLRPTHNMNGYWLANTYKQPRIQAQVYGMAVGSTMVNLNSSILANITIPLPSLQEQNQVAKTIRSSKEKILEEKKLLSKLKLQKAGLMDDLLTGRVRVIPLVDQPQTGTPG